MQAFTQTGAAFRHAYAQMLRHKHALLAPSAIYGLCLAAPDIMTFFAGNREGWLYVATIVLSMASLTLSIGAARIAFRLEDGLPISLGILFNYGSYLLPLIVLSFATGLPILAIGLLLFHYSPYAAIPFALVLAYFYLRIGFFPYVIAAANPEARPGVWEAICKSYQFTRGQEVFVLLLTTLEFLLLGLGSLTFGLAMFGAVPLTLFSFTYAYRLLNKPSTLG